MVISVCIAERSVSLQSLALLYHVIRNFTPSDRAYGITAEQTHTGHQLTGIIKVNNYTNSLTLPPSL